ncbi:MAG: hypothetical protein WD273_09775 [Trueperaceae bacterium]
MGTHFPDALRIERRGVISSTQDALRTELEAGRDVHGLLVRAEAQTKGKGRQERQWLSGPGGSYQTVAVRDDQGELRSGRVPLAIAVGIAESFLQRGEKLMLKWPNDLYRPRDAPAGSTPRGAKGARKGQPYGSLPGKVGGILCEHLRGHLLVGVGINVRNELPKDAAAFANLRVEDVSNIVLGGIRSGLTTVLPDPQLPARFARHDLLLGRSLVVQEGERRLLGRAAGVSSEGCLVLATEAGQIETCSGRIVEIEAAAYQ